MWEITAEPLNDANYEFYIEAEDQAGNVTTSTNLPLTIAEQYGYELDPITGVVTLHGEDGIRDVVTVSLDTRCSEPRGDLGSADDSRLPR